MMEIKKKKFDNVKPYSRNPKKHEGRSVEELKKSIRRFGFKNPILLDNDGEIVAGHGRYKACRELEGTLNERIEELYDEGKEDTAESLEVVNKGEILYMSAGNLSEKEIQKFRITHNRTQELSDYDDENLKFELREVEGAPGYSDEELNDLLDTEPDFTDLDDGEVEETAGELDDHYKDLTEDKQDDIVDVPCPHCGGSIKIDREEFKRRHLDEDAD